MFLAISGLWRTWAVSVIVFIYLAGVAKADAQCSPGTYSSSGMSPCTKCPSGTYQSQRGARSCTSAQAGWYVSGPGTTQQTQCGQGYYSTGGAGVCTICPAGTYCNSQTNTAPQKCQPGRYSAKPGAKQDCDQCPRGTFSDIYGATSCCSCCSGWYTDQVGQTHCFNCPNKGAFQQGWSPAGASSSSQCQAHTGALSSCMQSSDGTCPNTGGSVTSQTVKKRSETKRNPGRICATTGTKLCAVWRSYSGSSVAHECIDVKNDLESCGGCVDDPRNGEPSEDGGRDCTAIPNVDDMTCSDRTCKILQCSSGYALGNNGTSCVPSSHRRAMDEKLHKYVNGW